MKFGTTDPANFQAKEKAYNKTNEFLEKFSAGYYTTAYAG